MKKIAVFFAVVLCVFANKQTALSLDIEKTHNKNSAAIIKKYINIIDKNAICQKIIAPIKSVLSMTMLNAQPKHKLRLAFGLEAEKNSYAAGETVSVRYLHFASDSNYSFHTDSDDVTLRHEWDEKGMVIRFEMPNHDVRIWVKSTNTMENKNPPPSEKTIEYKSRPDNDFIGTWFCPECGAKNQRRYCSDCGLKKI
ncbi:MAG: hypothetical protein IKI11_01920 [Neisseriaceae bacterium]|nr:hypothetical protein [Neisseriaceae bacterium]